MRQVTATMAIQGLGGSGAPVVPCVRRQLSKVLSVATGALAVPAVTLSNTSEPPGLQQGQRRCGQQCQSSQCGRRSLGGQQNHMTIPGTAEVGVSGVGGI